MSLIEKNLYLCSYRECEELVSDLTIRGKDVFVINCTVQLPMIFPSNCDRERECEYGVRIAVEDDGEKKSMNIMYDSLMEIVANYNLIQAELEKGRHVIVHCFAGIQRSPTVVAAYLMKKYGCRPKDAIVFLRDKRSIVFLGRVNFEEPLQRFYDNFIRPLK
jgi:hypothetical protein